MHMDSLLLVYSENSRRINHGVNKKLFVPEVLNVQIG